MKKSVLIFLLLCTQIYLFSGTSFALSVYLPGVPDNFYDVEKSPSTDKDNDMCWAAAASNVLAWTGWDGGFTGDADGIFNNFISNWSNGGGLAEYGWEWWFTGTASVPSESGAAYPTDGGGGFYSEADFNASYQDWIFTYTGTLWSSFDPDGSLADQYIMEYINKGFGTVLNLYTIGKSHGITLWGYESDVNNNLLGVYVSDSDNDKTSYDPPDSLDYYQVSLGSTYTGFEDCWFLQNYLSEPGNDDWWIGGAQALKPSDSGPVTPSTIPEPTTLALLGTGLLVLLGFRRSDRTHS